LIALLALLITLLALLVSALALLVAALALLVGALGLLVAAPTRQALLIPTALLPSGLPPLPAGARLPGCGVRDGLAETPIHGLHTAQEVTRAFERVLQRLFLLLARRVPGLLELLVQRLQVGLDVQLQGDRGLPVPLLDRPA